MTTVNSAQLERMIREATTINATQKAMLHAARWWMDWQTLEFYPAIKTWAKAASLSHQTIITHVRKLQHLGVIDVGQREEVGRSRTNVYRLRPSALQVVIPSLFDEPVGCAGEKVKTASRKGQNGSGKRSNPQREKVKGFDTTCIYQGKQPPQPPRTRGNVPEFESAPAGRGRGGDSQSRQREDTPDAKPAGGAAEFPVSTTRKASQDTTRASEAINASATNPVVEALVALSVPRNEAVELAAIPHVDLSLVAFVSEQAARHKATIKRPARWIAKLVRGGPGELEGWDAHVAKQRDRERRSRESLIAMALRWAGEHANDGVYRQFIASAMAVIKHQFPTGWVQVCRECSIHPSVMCKGATPAEVLASMAASCGVDLEIPTDTLRMPEARGEVTQPRSQVQ